MPEHPTLIIPLTQGQVTIIDADDLPLIQRYGPWHAKKASCGETWYAAARYGVLMHRLILGLTAGDGILSDHKDGNGLNNRRANLRRATAKQNSRNRKKSLSRVRSPYKGVSFHQQTRLSRPWEARMICNGRAIYLGMYATDEEAARAYDAEAKRRFGAFASLNFPQGAAS